MMYTHRTQIYLSEEEKAALDAAKTNRGEPSRADPQGGSPPVREADNERPGGRGAHVGRSMGGAQLHRCRIRGGGTERCERQGVGSAKVVKLIDTSVALDHLQGELRATALTNDLLTRNEVVAASELTRAEVLAAIRPGERDALRAVLLGVLVGPGQRADLSGRRRSCERPPGRSPRRRSSRLPDRCHCDGHRRGTGDDEPEALPDAVRAQARLHPR